MWKSLWNIDKCEAVWVSTGTRTMSDYVWASELLTHANATGRALLSLVVVLSCESRITLLSTKRMIVTSSQFGCSALDIKRLATTFNPPMALVLIELTHTPLSSLNV